MPKKEQKQTNKNKQQKQKIPPIQIASSVGREIHCFQVEFGGFSRIRAPRQNSVGGKNANRSHVHQQVSYFSGAGPSIDFFLPAIMR